jgi:hypothetical protein
MKRVDLIRCAASATLLCLLGGIVQAAPSPLNGVREVAILKSHLNLRTDLTYASKSAPVNAAPVYFQTGDWECRVLPGLKDDNSTIPPGVSGAVGPYHLVTMHNSQVRITTRAGAQLAIMSLKQFWSALGQFATNRGPFDPRCLYNPFLKRWIASACCDSHSALSSLLLAMSDGDDPYEGWTFWKIDADITDKLWADYDMLGYAGDKIAITANLYDLNTDSFVKGNILVFSASDLSGGGVGAYTRFQEIASSFAPAINLDGDSEDLFLLQDWSGGAGTIRLSAIQGAPGEERALLGIAYPTTSEKWATMAGGDDDIAQQASTTHRIYCFDSRMQNCVIRNHTLWGAHTIFLPSKHPTRASIQWWQLSLKGDILQRGRMDDATGHCQYAYPSLSVNRNGDALIGFTKFDANDYPSAAFSKRLHGDPQNALSPATVYAHGTSAYYKVKTSGKNRWGDFTTTCVDPLDDDTLWTLQEYSSYPFSGESMWATAWARVGKPTSFWTGTIITDQALPVRNAQVHLYDLSSQSFIPLTAISDAYGNYQFDMRDIPAGRYHIGAWRLGYNSWVFSPWFQGWECAPNLPSPSPTVITLSYSSANRGAISGRCLCRTPQGLSSPAGKVHVKLFTGGDLVAETDTNERGDFLLSSIPAGLTANGSPWWGWYTLTATYRSPNGEEWRGALVNSAVWQNSILTYQLELLPCEPD